MEFERYVPKLYGQPSSTQLLYVDRAALKAVKKDAVKASQEVIDKLGVASARAQQLSHPITAVRKLVGTAHRCYLACRRKQALGFIKVGVKKLFVRSGTSEGTIHEIAPLCVLDFYVSEACQRQGVGLFLFKSMLACEGVSVLYFFSFENMTEYFINMML